MTNPQGPPSDPSRWGRPDTPGPVGNPQAPTERIQQVPPGPGRPSEPSTTPGPVSEQTEQIGVANTDARRTGTPRPPIPPAAPAPLAAPGDEPAEAKRKRRFLRDPLSIVLVLIIVVALVITGLIFAEWFARKTANTKIAEVVACEVKDQATAKFGVTPLVLWQLATQHFTNISVETAGNQIRDAKGMKLQFTIQNIQLNDTGTSKGTIGSIDINITWTAEGIKESVQSGIPVLGPFVTNTVTTDPKDGTIELKGLLNDIKAKPVVSGGGLELQIETFNTLGFTMPKETVQSTLNDFTNNLTKNFPLGIHADSVEVTSTGITSHFSSQNASIPTGQGGQDPCFDVI